MTDETAEQVLTRVLVDRLTLDDDVLQGLALATRKAPAHVAADIRRRAEQQAAELAAALEEAGLLIEGETVTEWGVEFGGDPVDDVFEHHQDIGPFVESIRRCIESGDYDAADYEPIAIVSRQRTLYPQRVTDWQPVEGGGDDAA